MLLTWLLFLSDFDWSMLHRMFRFRHDMNMTHQRQLLLDTYKEEGKKVTYLIVQMEKQSNPE